MLVIDKPVEYSSMQQFATQIDALSEEEKDTYGKMIQGNQSDEFYQGVVAGLAAAYQIAGVPDSQAHIGRSLAFVSDLICKRGL